MHFLMKPHKYLLLLSVIVITFLGCVSGDVRSNSDLVSTSEQPEETDWKIFLNAVYQEPLTDVYIADGDQTYSSIDALKAFYNVRRNQSVKNALIAHSTNAIVLSPDGKVAAIGTGKDIRVWLTDQWLEFSLLRGHANTVIKLSISTADVHLLASQSVDGNIIIWDWQSKKQHAHFSTQDPSINLLTESIALSKDGMCLAAAGQDRHSGKLKVVLWQTTTSNVKVLPAESFNTARDLVLKSPMVVDNEVIYPFYLGVAEGLIWIWEGGKLSQQLSIFFDKEITSLALSPDETLLAYESKKSFGLIFSDGVTTDEWPLSGIVTDMLFVGSTNKTLALATYSLSNTREVQLFDIDTETMSNTSLTGVQQNIVSMANVAGKMLFAAGLDGVVNKWDLESTDKLAKPFRLSQGTFAKWDIQEKLQLTYCVSDKKIDFGKHYEKIKNAMNTAARDWNVSAHVVFTHQSTEDPDCDANNNNVLFNVGKAPESVPYLARAFFPTDFPRAMRSILISRNTFQDGDEKSIAAVLRHELGHVLGFRHEHIRSPRCLGVEDSGWINVTEFDQYSIMNYPGCVGWSNLSGNLSQDDIKGAVKVYGDPNENITHLGNFSVSANQGLLRIAMSYSGSVDFFGKFDAQPTDLNYDCRSLDQTATIARAAIGNTEKACIVEIPASAQTINIVVQAAPNSHYTLKPLVYIGPSISLPDPYKKTTSFTAASNKSSKQR